MYITIKILLIVDKLKYNELLIYRDISPICIGEILSSRLRLLSVCSHLHVLVGSEESLGFSSSHAGEFTGLVDIKMSEGLGAVGIEVGVEFVTAETFMGSENFFGEGSELSGVHGEDTGWVVILIFFLGAVVVHNGVHEDLVIEVLWPSWVGVGGFLFHGAGCGGEGEESEEFH